MPFFFANRQVPLGDSITDICCWRSFAWQEITKAGLADQVDFVGSVTGIQGRCNAPSGFDMNHEGHSGWQAYDIAKNNIDAWMRQSSPDIVNVLLGTNDINIGKRSAATIVDAFTSLLSSMRTANPNVTVIVSSSHIQTTFPWVAESGAGGVAPPPSKERKGSLMLT